MLNSRTIAVSAIALAATSTLAIAQAPVLTLYDSEGFEAPRFVPGNLEGQDITFGPWLAETGTPIGNTTVQTNVVKEGSQAVQMNRTGQDEVYGVLKPIVPTEQFVVVEFCMWVDQAVSGGQNFGPFFGVQAYSQIDGGLLAGGFGVDSNTGEVLFQQGSTGFLDVTPGNDTVNFGEWNDFAIYLDYDNDLYYGVLNGAIVAQTTFVDDGSVGEITAFTDAPIVGLPAEGGASGLGAQGTSYFDNYRIYTTNAIPEPASLGLLGIAGLMLVRRRR